ncbi:type II secretion system protein [bacterium]|nr:type II secretion system protein [bacterium]
MKKAFTLAEVLITLVVIGVVAAITLPTMIQNYNEQERAAKVKKAYSTIAQALIKADALGGGSDFEAADGSDESIKEWYDTYMAPGLSTIRYCIYGNTMRQNGCWSTEDTIDAEGNKIPYSSGGGYGPGYNTASFVLADGTMATIDIFDPNDLWNIFGVKVKSNKGLAIYFDINGDRKPNKMGKDVFCLVYKDGSAVPCYADSSRATENCEKRTGVTATNGYWYDDEGNPHQYSGSWNADYNGRAGYGCIMKYMKKQ